MIAAKEDTPTRRGSAQGLVIGRRSGGRSRKPADAPMAERRRRAEQQHRICGRPAGPEVVPPDRADAKPRLRDRPVPDRTQVPAHAALAGALEYLRTGLEPGTLAIVQAAVKHQGSGWDYTIDDLRRYYEGVATRLKSSGQGSGSSRDAREGFDAPSGPPPFFAALEHWYLQPRRPSDDGPAELHLALADACDPAFAPEPLDRAPRLEALADEMLLHVERRSICWRSGLSTLDESSRTHADAVLATALTSLGASARFACARRRAAGESGSTATTISVRCCAPRKTSSSSTSRASRRVRSPSGAPSIAAQGCRRHDPVVQLRGLCCAVRVHRPCARRFRACSSHGPTPGNTGSRMRSSPRVSTRRDRRHGASAPRRVARLLSTRSCSTRRCTSSPTN